MQGSIESIHLLEGIETYLIRGEFTTRMSQRNAVREIIDYVLGEDVEYAHLPSGAPILLNTDRFISVSHCRNGVALTLSRDRAVGVDVESPREQLKRVASRFLDQAEYEDDSCSSTALLRDWTFKEAAYKLLQSFENAPSTIMEIALFDRRIISATLHFAEVTLTVATIS